MHTTTRLDVAVRLATLLALLAALAGCAGRYGSLQWDLGVGRSFETTQLLPGHRYYTTGSETGPDAILALREDRPLRSVAWRSVPMTPETLTRLVDRMKSTSSGDGPHGYAVLDDRGARIGAWYSAALPPPPRLLDDGGVDVAPPVHVAPLRIEPALPR